jgi:hypothetical protein
MCDAVEEDLAYHLTPGQPLQEAKATDYIYEYHRIQGLARPQITIVDSPVALHQKVAEYIRTKLGHQEAKLKLTQRNLRTLRDENNISLGDKDRCDLVINKVSLEKISALKDIMTKSLGNYNFTYYSLADYLRYHCQSLEFSGKIDMNRIYFNTIRNAALPLIAKPEKVYCKTNYFSTYLANNPYLHVLTKVGLISADNMIDISRCGIFTAIVFNDHWFLSRWPTKLHYTAVEEYNNKTKRKIKRPIFHSTTEKAVEFADGTGIYMIKNRLVNSNLFQRLVSGEYDRESFIRENNAETRSVAYEILGTEKLMDLLEAKQVNRHVFHHLNGDVEEVILYKTLKRFSELGNKPLAWVRFVCPSTGHNYLIDVEPHHRSAKMAALSTSPLFTSEEDYQFTDRA